MPKKIVPLLIALLIIGNSFSQTKIVDSLRSRLNEGGADTTKILWMIKIGRVFKNSRQPDSALSIHQKTLHMAEKLSDKCWLGKVLNEKAGDHFVNGNYDSAIYYARSSYDIYTSELNEKLSEKHKAAIKRGRYTAMEGISMVKKGLGDPDVYLRSGYDLVHLGEEYNDSTIIGSGLISVARAFCMIKDFKSGITNYHKAFTFLRGSDYLRNLCFGDLGVVYMEIKQTDSALKYTEMSMKLNEQIGNMISYYVSVVNLASIYMEQGDQIKGESKRLDHALPKYKKAIELLEQAKLHFEKRNDLVPLCTILSNIGNAYRIIKNYGLAEKNLKMSLDIALKLRLKKDLQWVHFYLFELKKETGDHKKALQEYESYIAYKDSIINEQTAKAAIKQELKYSFDKKAAADSVANAKESEIKSAELSRQSAEIKVKKNQQYALFGGLFLVCLFGIFMYNRFKITQKQKVVIEDQKEIVEEQKKMVEEKQSEILDSIRYARRIQMAQIPSEKRVEVMIRKVKGY